MIEPVPVVITVAILVAAWGGMVVSWRARRRRQQGVTLGAEGNEVGTSIVSVDGLYLATTFADRPLERVVAGGLGFRARATLTVTDRGVLLDRDGAEPLFVPKDDLQGAGVATWTIDRAVERNGLTVLRWAMHDGAASTQDASTQDASSGEAASIPVESSFRIDLEPRAALIAAVHNLVARGSVRAES